ncbi:cell filamentation protein Fic [Moraxella lacunata]|mgnify:CR=1 FL=1|uniref:protein adenylyltransferase n=2 Tax=Moraxella lacunata TaxID=477 RepID=A0A378UEQ8_MORLA|nr:Fic family protein [Moraxella lacunata]STZ74862.1 cell filamentation protein Fic [Moraxella lacunata]
MNQEEIEKLAYLRGLEIAERKDLINQTFDLKHLKSIHTYLFQDSQTERVAGSFRPVREDVHSKNRNETYSVRKPFYYEPLPNESKVDSIIKQANENLGQTQSPKKKIEILSNLYADLDYQHPFVEGNSRTIRTFLEHIAQNHGIELDWRSTAQNKDEFYRARDFEIAKRNNEINPTNDIEAYMLEEAKRYNTQDYIATQIAIHNGRYLHQIIKDCCNYPHKELLETFEPKNTKNQYPNLSNDNAQKIEIMAMQILLKCPDNFEAQKKGLEMLQEQIPDIASGKIPMPDFPDLDKGKGR